MNSTAPRLSLSLRSRAMCAREMVERATAGREAGVDAIYVGDHHSEVGGYVQNNVILGRLLADWGGDIGAVYLLPLWHPVLLAEQVGTLAEMAGGRFVLQAALGYGEAQFAAMGADLGGRVPLFEAGFDVVRRLLAGERVTSEAPFRIDGAQMAAADDVAFWVAGHSDNALARAARLAEGWVAGPGVSVAEAVDMARRYRERCDEAARSHGETAIRRDVYVGASRADADRIASSISGYRGFDPSVLVIGDAGQVAAELGALVAGGFSEIIVRQLVDDQTLALSSIERMREVGQRMGGR